ncbi:hypothetical protein N566_05715 [Streptomycetaceae bacterium MP113-05]|nr:hypothetical protein N566_05715 [Streptomycetaceae bacterium MP113-05]
MTRIADSHQAQWLDALHRHHAVVEDHVRTNKAMGLHNLPSKSWTVNQAWMLTCNLAADLHSWLRLLTLHDQDDLADAEPDTMRFRLYHLPARLAQHARRRWLRIETTWPWAGPGPQRSPPHGDGSPNSRPSSDGRPPTRQHQEGTAQHTPGDVEPRRGRSDTRRSHPTPAGTNGMNRSPRHQAITADESRPRMAG